MAWNGHDNDMFYGSNMPGPPAHPGMPFTNAFGFNGNFPPRAGSFPTPFENPFPQPTWFRQAEAPVAQFRPQFRDFQALPFPGMSVSVSQNMPMEPIRQAPMQEPMQNFGQQQAAGYREDVQNFCSPAATTSSPVNPAPDLQGRVEVSNPPEVGGGSVQPEQAEEEPSPSIEGADFWRTPAAGSTQVAQVAPMERAAGKQAGGPVWRPNLGYSRLEMLRSAKKDVWRPGVRMDRGPTLRHAGNSNQGQGPYPPTESPGSSECTDNWVAQDKPPQTGSRGQGGAPAVTIFRPNCFMSDGGTTRSRPGRSRMEALRNRTGSAPSGAVAGAPQSTGWNRNATDQQQQQQQQPPPRMSGQQPYMSSVANGSAPYRQTPAAASNDLQVVPDLDLGVDESVMDSLGFDTGQDTVDVWQAARRDQQERLDSGVPWQPPPVRKEEARSAEPPPERNDTGQREEPAPAVVKPRQRPPAQQPPPEKPPEKQKQSKKGSMYAQKGKGKRRESPLHSPAGAGSDTGKPGKQESRAKSTESKSQRGSKGSASGAERSSGGKHKERPKKVTPPASLMFYIPRRARSASRRCPRAIPKIRHKLSSDQKPRKHKGGPRLLLPGGKGTATPSAASGSGHYPPMKESKRPLTSAAASSRGDERRRPPIVAPKPNMNYSSEKPAVAKLKLKPLSLLSAASTDVRPGSSDTKRKSPQVGNSSEGGTTDSDTAPIAPVLSSQRPSKVARVFDAFPRATVIGPPGGSEKKRKYAEGKPSGDGRAILGKLKKKEHKEHKSHKEHKERKERKEHHSGSLKPRLDPRLAVPRADKVSSATSSVSGRKEPKVGPAKGSMAVAQKAKLAGSASVIASKKYYPGDITWAKLGSFPWWPAQVQLTSQPEHNNIPHKATDYFLVFYGDQNVNWLPETALRPFHWNYERHSLVKGRSLQAAIDEAWEAMGKERPKIAPGEKVNPAMFLK